MYLELIYQLLKFNDLFSIYFELEKELKIFAFHILRIGILILHIILCKCPDKSHPQNQEYPSDLE